MRYLGSLALCTALSASALGACTARSAVNTQCAVNSDCLDPLVCAGGACRSACNEDRDCPGSPAYCIAAPQGASRICVSPGFAPLCSARTSCPAGRLCTEEGLCVPSCTRDADCTSLHPNSYCAVTGQCALPGLSDAGRPPPADAAPEASADGSTDAPSEASADASTDTAAEADLDAPTDAPAEATPDANAEAGLDATMDATVDAIMDAPPDAAPLDAPAESGVDAAADVVPDVCNSACISSLQQLVWPPNGAFLTGNPPTLRFSNGYSAMTQVDICTTRGCTAALSVRVTGNSFTPTMTLTPGVHFWRIRPFTTSILPNPSPVWEFYVPPLVSTGITAYSAGRVLDLDGDGRGDLAVGAPSTASGQGAVQVYFARGNFAAPTTLTPPGAAAAIANAAFGSIVSPAGDFDGDGFGDLLVVAPGYNGGQGGAWIYRGNGATGIETTPSITLTHTTGPTERFGLSAAGVGDMDGDGYGDVALGVPGIVGSGTGYVLLYLGQPALGNVNYGATFTGAMGWNLGTVVEGPGDLNGDGYDDLLATTNTTLGIVQQHLGGRRFPSTATGNQRTVSPAPASHFFGAAMTGAGDINGDGLPDVVVGAPRAPTARGNGALWTCLSTSSGLAATCSMSAAIPPGVTSVAYGSALAGGFDLTGDGYPELLAADPQVAPSGAVYVLTGMSGAVTLRTSILSGDGTTTSFGLGLTLLGDYDADGVFDYAVGSAGSSSGQGAVRVFRGPFGPVNLTPTFTLMGSGAGVRFGQSVALRSPRRWHLAHLLAER